MNKSFRALLAALGVVMAAGVAPRAVSAQFSVTPYGAAAPPQSGQVTFTIYNDRAVGELEMDTFELTCDISGGVDGCQADMYASVWRGSSAETYVSYSVAGSGQLGLTAYSPHEMGSTDRGWYTVTVAAATVSVTPDGGAVTRTASGSYSETFTVQNTGTQTTTFSFTQLCSGAGVINCSTPSSVTLAPNATTTASVSYTAGGGSTSGTVALRASGGGSQDDGSISVTVSPTASVDVGSSEAPLRFQPNSTDSLTFTIHNTGSVAGTFSLQAICSTAATNCQTSGGPITLAAGAAVDREVSFTAPPNGKTGAVALRATNSIDAAKTDLATLNVTSDGHPSEPYYPTPGPEDPVPIITVTPAFKRLYLNSGLAVNVEIVWCLPGPGAWRSLAVRHESPEGARWITNAFTTDSGQAPQPANCMDPNASWARSTGTVTIPPVEGVNIITASAFTLESAYGSAEGRYELVPPPRSISVVAAGQESEPLAGATAQTARFTVTNTGEGRERFKLSGLCSNAASCTVPSNWEVALDAGQSTDLTVTYSVSGSVGQLGMVRLTATNKQDTTVVDSSWTEVTVVAAPAAGVVPLGGRDVLERDLCLTAAAGPDAAIECGDLRAVHALPSMRTLNKSRTPTLLFNSQHADPMAMVSANVTLPSGDDLSGTVVASLTINGATLTQTRNASEWGAPLVQKRITIGVDGSTYATGLYPYQLEVRRINGGSNTLLGLVSSELPVVNRRQSPFGAGWSLAGLEELVIQDDSIMWVGGDGSARRYRRVAGTQTWLATRVDRPDTLTFDGSSYSRHLPNNLRVRFNSSGRHVSTTNRLGHVTSFVWGTAGGRAVLDSLVVPVVSGRRAYKFAYNANGWLDSVIAPYSTGTRATKLTTDATGRVSQIRDPDLKTVSFGYDPVVSRRITSRTDRRSFTTSFAYDAGGRVTQHSTAMGGGVTIAQSYRPLETLGLPGTARGTAQALDSAFAQIDGPLAGEADVSKLWFTSFGTLRRIRNPLGRESRILYGDTLFPALATEVRDPAWFVTASTYNSRGLIERIVAVNSRGTAQNDTTTYAWHPTWAMPTGITSPMGVGETIQYNATTGNREWQESGGSANRVSFAYDATTGLPRLVTVPGVTPDTLTYDNSLGNLASVRAPTGAVTQMLTDAIGRDTLALSPIDATHTGWTRTMYDEMDRVRRSIQFGPSMAADIPADSVGVVHVYDNEGNLTSVKRTRGMNAGAHDSLSTSYGYDGLGRKVSESNPGSAPVVFRYDDAGNLKEHETGNGIVTLQYNAGGQLIKRLVPSRMYGSTGCGIVTEEALCQFSFPTRGTSVCLPYDTARFGYDAAGRMRRADNIHARITRSFTRGGLVASEVQRLRGYYSGGASPCELVPNGGYVSEFDRHVFALRYTYNRDGQRDSLIYPGGVQTSAYGDGRGLLTQVINGSSFAIGYDAAGRIDTVAYPGGVNDVRTYDAIGRLRRRNVGIDLLDDSLTYDWQGRILDAVRPDRPDRPTAWARYNGLGAVVKALDYTSTSAWNEEFKVDALGNRLWTKHPGIRPQTHPDFWGVRVSAYDAAGRLATVQDSFTVYNAPYEYLDRRTYDPAGNTDYSYRHDAAQVGNATLHSHDSDKSYYGSDGKLRVFNRHLGLGAVSADTLPGNHGAFEEYWYDALGRRVLVRSRRGTACLTSVSGYACASYIERVVWDGDQLLQEYRANGADSVSVTALEDSASAGDAFGAVTYTHALGLDQPLSVRKGSGVVMPHANWRGQYALGTLSSGRCGGGGEPACPNLDWPGGRTTLDGEKVSSEPVQLWWGNLITNKTDGSGLQYMRNRYYDPKTGRFTQEDPIGLAGGLNLYGYAGGDPVNFSDPFGLWPTGTHNAMLEYAFGQGKDVVALKRASFAADRGAGSQEIFRSYRHGMAEPVESPNAARGKANRFISHSLARARALAADGDRDGALAELGAAFHTMMDQASPAHTDENGNPREWGGMNNLNGLRKHIARESGRPSKEVMDATAERMRAAYTSVFGKP